MAMSSYLEGLVWIILLYPLSLCLITIFVPDSVMKMTTRVFNVSCAFLFAFCLIMHMQIEVVYGKELLDAWYQNNPQ
ncbi:hypothetical protein [Enterovibrio coralii]|uniref:Uncharacterized protein n=1 Tax=Enterovibrio coralii TaxID=294935 RepID=A0A135IB13_9GAMM|nr:hypothetical protein [Enterovibrio coralii]KXF82632.1 hypothetical protein ATN88_21470 [Enterovibrio coralii]